MSIKLFPDACAFERDASALNTRPDAPVEGLDTIGYHIVGSKTAITKDKDLTARWMLGNPNSKIEELVTRPNAESIIAAERNRAEVAEYKLDQAVNTVQPMIVQRAERAEADNAALTARVKELGGNLEFADKSLAREVSLTASFEAKLAEALAAAKLVEDWWLSEGVKHFDVTPCCFFATRSVLGGKTS